MRRAHPTPHGESTEAHGAFLVQCKRRALDGTFIFVACSPRRPDKEGLLLPTKFCLSRLLYLALVLSLPGNTSAAADSSSAGILKAPDMANLMPATVFFRGQVASVQARNSGGVKLADGMLVLCALVDTSGYSTAVQQKYQG